MKLFTLKRFFTATLLMCLSASQIQASVFTTYSKAEVYAQAGNGKVYVTDDSNKKPQDNEYRTTSNASHSSILSSHTYYIFAKADEGSVFAGWYGNKDLSGAPSSNNLASSFSVFTNQRNESSAPVGSRYAKFQTKHEILEANGFTKDEITYLLNSTKVKDAKVVADLANATAATLSETAADNSNVGNKNAVVVERSFWTGEWNTFCMPFDINREDLLDDNITAVQELSYVTESNGNYTLHFGDTGETLEAGKSYIVWVNSIKEESGEEGKITKIFGASDFEYTAPSLEKIDNVLFQGVYDKGTVPNGGNCLILSGNKFYTVKGTTSIMGFRGYFVLPEGTASHSLGASFENEDVTGMNFVNDNENEDESENTYNIAGQRVNENAKGIIIKNGKKYLVK